MCNTKIVLGSISVSMKGIDLTEDRTVSTFGEDYSETSEDFEDEDDEEAVFDDIEEELMSFAKRKIRRTHSVNDTTLAARRTRSSTDAPKSLRRAVTMPAMSSEDFLNRMNQAAAKNGYYQDPKKLNSEAEVIRTDQFLRDALSGISADSFDCQQWEAYFAVVTEERIAAHSVKVSEAIRRGNIDKLRQLHEEQGASFDSCNSHGESMMHLACRLGKIEVVEYLMKEAHVSVRARDDQGKTPLHDVCWSNKPNFELVRCIVEQSPELLFISDYRGFAAFTYIPNSCWKEWNEWIESNTEWLEQKVKDSRWLKVQQDMDSAQARMQRLLAKAALAMES